MQMQKQWQLFSNKDEPFGHIPTFMYHLLNFLGKAYMLQDLLQIQS